MQHSGESGVTLAMISTPPALVRLGVVLPLLLGLLFAGCASDEGRPRGAGRAREHFPTLAGHETFFQGGLTAEVRVGAMTGFDLPGGPGREGGGGGRPPGGGMRMHRNGGMPGSAPGGMGRLNDDGDGTGREQSLATRRAAGMGSPPVMIHLRFANNSPARMDVVIADFLSPLGNFVVQPEKFSLQPGEALTVEPMTSRLAGEIGGGEISLSLKAGDVTETKTIALELVPEGLPAEGTSNIQH